MNWMAFFKRHIIGFGLAIVVLALLVNLVVQYRSLAKLGEALPAARKATISKELYLIDDEIQSFYLATARHAFDVPAAVFNPDLVAKDGEYEALDLAVKNHFRNKPAIGVKRYFVLTLSKPTGKRILSMYDPKTGAMLEGYTPPEGWAAFVAGAPWMTLMWRNVAATREPSLAASRLPEIKSDTMLFADSDPDNPIILKPVTDESSNLTGIAGLVIDKPYFRESVLPGIIQQAQEKHSPGNRACR